VKSFSLPLTAIFASYRLLVVACSQGLFKAKLSTDIIIYYFHAETATNNVIYITFKNYIA